MKAGNWFTEGFGAAIADIREKLVDEAWFGRTTMPSHRPEGQGLTEGLGWTQQTPEPNQQPAVQDQGMDRNR